MPAPLNQFEKGRIVALINSGVTQIDVARQLNISERTVRRIMTRYNIEGHANPLPIPGRPRVLQEEDDNNIFETINGNGFQSSRQIVSDLNIDCSARTVQRRLREHGYYHHIPVQKETLTANHKEQRLAFALEHLGWQEEWMCTIFSDEKVFSTDESGRVTLWRTKGTRYAEENVYNEFITAL